MVQFLSLPTARMPTNALLDVSGLSNAIDSNRKNALLQRESARQDEELSMRKASAGRAEARESKRDARSDVEWFGKQASAFDRALKTGAVKGPQAQAAWDRILSRHPDRASLTPEYLNPMTGPALVAAEAGQWRDPREDELADLKLQREKAEIAKLNATAADTGATYGKTGSIFQDPQSGQFYSVQFGADGSRKIEPLQANGQNITPARGVGVEGNVMYNRATGEAVRDMSGAVAGGEQAKAIGKAEGEGQVKWPKAQLAFQNFENKSQRLEETIDRAIGRVGPWTTGVGGVLANIPGTEAKALAGDLDTIRANVGFEELQAMRDASPTGGALGQVSEMENRLLQSVRASIDQLQNGENVAQNLGIIKQSVKQLRAVQKQKYDADAQRFGGGQTAQPAIPPQAVQMLAADPSVDAIREFDEMFGAGAAQRVLNGR